jgi:hypothetical protein
MLYWYLYILSLFFGLFCLYCEFSRPIWFVRARKRVFRGFWGDVLYIALALFITLGAIYVLVYG